MPYWFPFGYQVKWQAVMKKVCLEWREEQFRKAITKQNVHVTAQEALHCQVCWQCMDPGAAPQAWRRRSYSQLSTYLLGR